MYYTVLYIYCYRLIYIYYCNHTVSFLAAKGKRETWSLI